MLMRPSNRQPDEMQAVCITRNYTKHAEGHPYSKDKLNTMLELAEKGIKELFAVQQETINQ